MAQTKKGVEKLRETMIAKHGSEEAYRAYMASIAPLSKKSWVENGKKPMGFATNKELARESGRKGGKVKKHE